ncbi:MAG TPA: Lpg1974 family pore-forming outer membrane protein [Rhabdochlamydiaceae bacterium]|nr:Lpg1974 family pore-forming outer membrane protein [Rhabdochlamydiaceae bacterium]
MNFCKPILSCCFLLSFKTLLLATDYQSSCEYMAAPQCSILYSPPAAFDSCEPWQIFAQLDGIYWFTKEDNLDYAIKDHNPPNNFSNFQPKFPFGQLPNNNARVINVAGSWDWGFRAKLGGYFADDIWDLTVVWTRFYTNKDSHVTAQPNERLFTTMIFPFVPLSLTSLFGNSFFEAAVASAKWTMHEDLVDLECGRDSWVGSCLSIRPYAAVRTSWIKQGLDVNYFKIPGLFSAAGVLLTPGLSEIDVKTKNHFWGIGPRAGVSSFWHLNDSWGIYGDISASLIWGYFNIHMQEVDIPDFVPMREDIKSDFSSQQANLDFRVGIQWEHYFCENKRKLMFALGWDEQIWFKQNQLYMIFFNLPFDVKNGDLILSGVTLSGRWEF